MCHAAAPARQCVRAVSIDNNGAAPLQQVVFSAWGPWQPKISANVFGERLQQLAGIASVSRRPGQFEGGNLVSLCKLVQLACNLCTLDQLEEPGLVGQCRAGQPPISLWELDAAAVLEPCRLQQPA